MTSHTITRLSMMVAFLVIASSSVCAQSWDMFAEYSTTSNPTGVWSYGRKWTVEGSGFDLMPVTWGCCGWWFGNSGHGGPSIHGGGGVNLWAKNNTNGYPVVRWTSPASGFYKLTGVFSVADSRGGDNLVYVVINGAMQFSDHIQGNLDTVEYSFDKIFLQEGDHIDFLIVWNGVGCSECGWTMVTGTIKKLRTPVECHGLTPTITGTRRDDLLIGTESDDVISGLEGNDIIYGRGGDDVICGGPGNDTIFGGAGNDRIFGDGGADLLFGEGGNDTIRGGGGRDTLFGGSGADTLFGDRGDDLLLGDSGNDTLHGGSDTDVCDDINDIPPAQACEITL